MQPLACGTELAFTAAQMNEQNVFWQISGAAELGTTSHFEGVVMCQTSVTLRTGASIEGRLMAQTAVSIDSSTVVQP